jgi:hypothetical protein
MLKEAGHVKHTIERSPTSDAPKATGSPLQHQSPARRFQAIVASVWRCRTTLITIFSVASILLHVLLRFGLGQHPEVSHVPLLATFVFGGIPPVWPSDKTVM